MPLKGYYRNELEKVDKGSKRLREVMDGLSPAFFVGMLTVEGVMTYQSHLPRSYWPRIKRCHWSAF